MADDTDAELIAAALAGQVAAYGLLVRRHQRRLVLGLLALCRDRELAEDLAQDAFLRAHAKLPLYDPARPFPPWLFQIAVNLWRNRLRREGRELGLEELSPEAEAGRWADAGPSPEARAEAAELRGRVWAAVATLPEDARQIVILRHAMELSYEEIAAATGLPMGTVKSRLSRARAELAEVLRDLVE